MALQSMLPQDRPRERAYRLGMGALTDAELLALLLGTGQAGHDTLETAAQLLGSVTVSELGRASPIALERLAGIGPAKACRVAGAFELGRRAGVAAPSPLITCSRDAAQYLAPHWQRLPQEHFGILLLNTRHKVLGMRTVAVGTADASLVHPRDVFREAVAANAAALIAFHNHPSGSPEPSEEDRALTARLIEAGLLMGIPVLDHIILGEDSAYSLSDGQTFNL